MIKFILTITFLLTSYFIFSQELTQTVRGTIVDKDSKNAIAAVEIKLINSTTEINSSSDINGNFILLQIPVGRQSFEVTAVGYKSEIVSDVQINVAKEIVLSIELEQKTEVLAEIVIKSGNSKDRTVNQLIGVSGRTFSLDEANRFAGSQNDPSRMARNYAGVSGSSDQRNDIIIRGNSPQGLLWRIDGIPVPNPNHFAAQGSTGGPISIINYKLLSNSDFITGAFPAEYGNATSGVFDIKMRNGNDKKSERTLQVGALGLEAILEGPFSKKSASSYLIAYRYSTLGLLSKANLKIGFASIPSYQDLSFKVNIVTKKIGTFKLFGLGGTSSTDFLDSKRDETQFSPANKGENVQFGSKTAIVGLTHNYFLNTKSFIKTSIATTYEGNENKRDSIQANGTTKITGGFGYSNKKFVFSSLYNNKINTKNTFQAGAILENINYKTKDSLLLYKPIAGKPFFGYNNDFGGTTNLVQTYAQWKYKFNDKLILNSGLHFQYLTLNSKYAIEPRVALNYKFEENQMLSFGYGLHNQAQPYAMYFFKDKFTPSVETNKNLGFTQSNQFILGYDLNLKKDFRIKTEAYYQYLSNIPVEKNSSSYSVLNYGATFYNTYKANLANNGIGYNYGVELTVEKFFSNNYYFLMTTSLFQSKYKGSDGVERNTAFNGNYVFNVLGGYELKLKRNFTMLFDAKLTYAGGLRFSPIDIPASVINQEATYIDNLAFSQQNKAYFKPDVKVTVRKNFQNKMALEWALDIQNIVNYQNVFINLYDKNTQTERVAFQNGRFPTVQLKLEF